MARRASKLAPGWWDYTTLDEELTEDAARLTARDIEQLARPGFEINFYDTLEEFYLAEAMEYVSAWRQAAPGRPAGVCGPIGPVEQLPLVARIVNSLELDLRDAHFWGMDEWVEGGRAVPPEHPLSFLTADMALCFNRIDAKLRMPDGRLHFPVGDLAAYSASFDEVRCVVMQGGQGDVKHWAFNDPPRRQGEYTDQPPPPEEYRRLPARVVELHPGTVSQNARQIGGGNTNLVPTGAATVGPVETWKAETVSIWHPGCHDNAFGMRLTALMISKGIADTSVPMSLLADHPGVRFSYYRPGLGVAAGKIQPDRGT